MNVTGLTLLGLRKMLDNKEISAKELSAEYIKRIKEINPKLSALITVTEEEALKNADKAQEIIDKNENVSALTGIPAVLKDNICTDGIRTTCASKMLEDFIPPYDACVVEQLKDSGYVLLGKSTLDEFAMGGATQTGILKGKNPYDLECVPGGSSGGSAAAVSAGLCGFALGSDTGGSIRQPASFCGVTGIKPTYGRVSRFGVVAYASSFDQVGVLAKNAYDCGMVLNHISAHDWRDANSKKIEKIEIPDFTAKTSENISGMRIAIPKEFYGDEIDSEVKTAVMSAAREYEKKGAVLVDCSMKTLKYAVSTYYLIASAEAASNLAKFDGIKFGLRGEGRTYEEMIRDSRNKGFGDEVKRRILLGNYALSSGYYDAYYRKAMALRQEIIKEYDRIFETADVILTPTAPCPAYKIGSPKQSVIQMYMADMCTVTVNIAGLPAISTTCAYSNNSGSTGMPIGMSLIGKKFDEATIIQAADSFERDFETIPPKFLIEN